MHFQLKRKSCVSKHMLDVIRIENSMFVNRNEFFFNGCSDRSYSEWFSRGKTKEEEQIPNVVLMSVEKKHGM